MKATISPKAIQNGCVNIRGLQSSLPAGDKMMECLLHYNNVRWGAEEITSGSIYDLPGHLVSVYCRDAAMLIRGIYNNHPIALEAYEKDGSFQKFKTEYLKTGRYPALSEIDFTKSHLVKMMLCLTGITLEFVSRIRQHNIKASVQQILGSRWIDHFRTFYCTYSEVKDHYDLEICKLPTFCRLPANMGKVIFKVSSLHRDILIRENCSFTIPQQK